MSTLQEFYSSVVIILLQGLKVTIYLSLISAVLTLVIGLIFGIVRGSNMPFIPYIVAAYVLVIRAAPPLILFFIIYYVLPFFGITLSAFSSAVLGLVLHQGAYMTEIFRSGFRSINKGQYEAAQALGFSFLQKMRYIVFPQALKIMLPALGGQMVLLVKDTALVSLIGLGELTRIGKQLVQRGENPFIIFGLVAAFYFVFCYPIINSAGRLETRNEY